MNIELHPDLVKEFEYIVQLQQKYGAPNVHESVESLINYVLFSIADGSRRPGAWERQMLELMGIIANCPEHNCYRANYGPAETNGNGKPEDDCEPHTLDK